MIISPVSYTHLDVYKRQYILRLLSYFHLVFQFSLYNSGCLSNLFHQFVYYCPCFEDSLKVNLFDYSNHMDSGLRSLIFVRLTLTYITFIKASCTLKTKVFSPINKLLAIYCKLNGRSDSFAFCVLPLTYFLTNQDDEDQ